MPNQRKSKEEIIMGIVQDGFQNDYDKMDNLVRVFKYHEVVENIIIQSGEWAKQEAILFARFLDDLKVNADKYFNVPKSATTEELYTLFLTTKS